MHDNLEHVEHEQEGHMAKSDLYRSAKCAIKLFELIEDSQDLEAWVQTEISTAADRLDRVYHYLEYELKYAGQKPHGDVESMAGDHQRELTMSDPSLDDERIDLSSIAETTSYDQQLANLLEAAQLSELSNTTYSHVISTNMQDLIKHSINFGAEGDKISKKSSGRVTDSLRGIQKAEKTINRATNLMARKDAKNGVKKESPRSPIAESEDCPETITNKKKTPIKATKTVKQSSSNKGPAPKTVSKGKPVKGKPVKGSGGKMWETIKESVSDISVVKTTLIESEDLTRIKKLSGL